jgi:serine/threonine-protein kinase
VTEPPRQTKSFWQTLPGILTGVAAILTAVGAILGILFQLGVIGGSPDSTTPSGSSIRTPKSASPTSAAPADAGGWENATAIMTANDGSTYRSRASTFRYCISAGAGVNVNKAQDVAFEKMTLLEVLRSDVALSPGGRADVRITLTTGTVLTGTIDAGCDFIMQADAGRVSLYPDKVRKIEFQRPT